MSDVTEGSLVVSSSAQGAGTVFNLHDEKNAVTLLKKIHQSPISPDEKNELRDAVFVFRNNPASEITPEFTEKFAEFGFTLGESIQEVPVPQIPVTVPVVSPTNNLGTTRPSPMFSGVVAQPVVTDKTVEPQVVTTEVTHAAADTAPEPEVSKEEPEPAAAVTPSVSEVPVAPTAAPAVPVIPEPVVESNVPAAAPVEKQTAAISETSTTGVALERIKEIKREVNLLVGNPVNLIDVDNDVGREYMNSLLDAMKKNNGGTADQVGRAMERLETAFALVKETVGTAGAIAQEKPVEPEVSKEEPEPVAAVTPPVSEVPVAPIVPKAPTAPVDPKVAVKDGKPSASGYAAMQQQVEKTAATPEPVVATLEPEVTVPENPTIPTQVAPPAPEETPAPQPEIPTPAQPVEVQEDQTAANAAGGIMSVAKEKQIQDLMTAQKQEAATTDQQKQAAEIASMDPLMTPEVTNGLQQLLSQWTLFKSSGIFGTGASGMEHSLYKQLAVLNMTAIVAGRYEGATPQIKRSITDYMNGWRYEEGILQEQGELFEHYLRRVIKHILDKRK